MLLAPNDVIFISHRRMFESDEARFFLGRVVLCEDALIKVEGYSFVRDFSSGHTIRKDEKRVKLVSLASAGYIVYQLSGDVDIDNAQIETHDGESVLVDCGRPLMNMSERVHYGHF